MPREMIVVPSLRASEGYKIRLIDYLLNLLLIYIFLNRLIEKCAGFLYDMFMKEILGQNLEQPDLLDEQNTAEAVEELNNEEKTEADLLVERRDSLKESVEEYITDGRFSQDWGIVLECPKEEIASRFREMVGRIFEETPVLKEIEDTIGKENILNGFTQSKKFPTAVQFESGSELAKKDADRGSKKTATLGDYNTHTEVIRIRDKIPECEDIWRDLSWGNMPKVLRTLDHELIHHQHNKERKRKELDVREKIFLLRAMMQKTIYDNILWIAQYIAPIEIMNQVQKKQIELYQNIRDVRDQIKERNLYDEAAAQKAGNVYNKESYKTTSLLNILVSAYGYNDKGDIDRIILASQAIDRLRALGLSDSEITQSFVEARYDPESVSIPSVDKKIEELAEQHGLILEDIDTMVDLMRVQGEGDMYEAATIAQGALERFAEDKKEKNKI